METRTSYLKALLAVVVVTAAPNAIRCQDSLGAADVFDAAPDTGGLDSIFGDVSAPIDSRPRASSSDAPPTLSEREQKWSSLRKKVLEASSDADRKKNADEMKTFLEQVFDEDLVRREKELGKLESRIQKLRSSVERRKSNRDRIIKVRLDALMLDAEGLGLPGLGSPLRGLNTPIPAPTINSYKVLGRNRDGGTAVRIEYTTYRDEQRTRMVAQTVFRKKSGSNQLVPVNQQREEVYTVQVPVNVTKDVLVPSGEDIPTYLNTEIRKPEAVAGDSRKSKRRDKASDLFDQIGELDSPDDDGLFGN